MLNPNLGRPTQKKGCLLAKVEPTHKHSILGGSISYYSYEGNIVRELIDIVATLIIQLAL